MDKDLKHKPIPADVLPAIEKQKQVVQVIVRLLGWICENPLEQKVCPSLFESIFIQFVLGKRQHKSNHFKCYQYFANGKSSC